MSLDFYGLLAAIQTNPPPVARLRNFASINIKVFDFYLEPLALFPYYILFFFLLPIKPPLPEH